MDVDVLNALPIKSQNWNDDFFLSISHDLCFGSFSILES